MGKDYGFEAVGIGTGQDFGKTGRGVAFLPKEVPRRFDQTVARAGRSVTWRRAGPDSPGSTSTRIRALRHPHLPARCLLS